jgi:hypothetical protein
MGAKIELKAYTYKHLYIIESSLNLTLVFNKESKILEGYNYTLPSNNGLANMGVSRLTYIKSALAVMRKKISVPLTLENAPRYFRMLIKKYEETYGKSSRIKSNKE